MKIIKLLYAILIFFTYVHGPLLACSGTGEDVPYTLAARVALSAENTYRLINDAWSYPKQGKAFTTASPHWKAQEDYAHLRLNISYLSQECGDGPLDFCAAYDSLVASPAALECRLAVQLAQTMAARACLGDKLFNNLSLQLWQKLTMTKRRGEFFERLASHFWKFEPFQEANMIGASVYITNLDDYLQRNPKGSFRGHNLVCVGEDLFMGFGEIFKDGPVGSEAVWQDLYTAYGDKTMSYGVFCAKQELCQNRYLTMGRLNESAIQGVLDATQDNLCLFFEL